MARRSAHTHIHNVEHLSNGSTYLLYYSQRSETIAVMPTMPNPINQINISTAFTSEHERVLTDYLSGKQALDTTARQMLYIAIDLLGQSEIAIDNDTFTFRQIYNQHIDSQFATPYFEELLALTDVSTQSPTLTAKFARQIASTLEQAELFIRANPKSFLLYAYCVYWWQSFARGYAFEVEIMHDLENEQIDFAMHDLLNESERYSQADLVVLDLMGDIKTSTYFLQQQSSGPLRNDFYITRLYEKGQSRTLVVFQKPQAWERIEGGETISGTVNNVLTLLPKPVQLEHSEVKLVVIEYAEWKKMVQRIQRQEGK